MKICNKCKLEKSLEEFYKHSYSTDGYRTICKSCDKDNRLRTPKNPENVLKSELKRLYNMTLEQYYILLKHQNYSCAICMGTNSNGHRLSVDHNHVTTKVRGLLCGNCNWVLGLLKENRVLFQRADNYLERYDAI